VGLAEKHLRHGSELTAKARVTHPYDANSNAMTKTGATGCT
jgi:hypothetical protein